MLLWFLFLFTAAAWGGSYLFMRIAAPHFEPATLAALRLGIASLVLLGSAWPVRAALRKQWKGLLWLGFLNAALPFSLIAWAMRDLHAGHGAILNSTFPLFVAVVGQAFLGQAQTKWVWLGLGLGLAGVAVSLEPWKTGLTPQLLPTAAALSAMLCYGWAAHHARRFEKMPPLAVTWANCFAGFLILLAPALLRLPATSPPAGVWLAVLGLGVISTALALAAFFKIFQTWGPLRTSMITYLSPFFGMTWGWLFLGEPVKAGWLPGLALVLLGLGMVRSGNEKIRP